MVADDEEGLEDQEIKIEKSEGELKNERIKPLVIDFDETENDFMVRYPILLDDIQEYMHWNERLYHAHMQH